MRENIIEQEKLDSDVENNSQIDTLDEEAYEVDTGSYDNEEDESGLSHPKDYNPKEALNEIIATNNLDYNSKSYSIEWLVDRLGKGKYKIPAYQRRYVWNEEQVTALIVSLLKKMPIPILYGYYMEEKDIEQATLIIDGQQRLTSLFMYYWGIFPKFKNRMDYATNLRDISEQCEIYYSESSLKKDKNTAKEKLEKTYKLNVDHEFIYLANEVDERQHKINLSYRTKSDLTEQQKFRLLDRELDFLIVEGDNFSDAVDLFRIYNSAGTPLNTQEIRNGVYQNNCLYKKINNYSDNILIKGGDHYNTNHSWSKFNRKGAMGDRMEIKKLFQLLSYHFAFSHSVERPDSSHYKFEKRDSFLLMFLKNRKKEELSSIELEVYNKHYRKKGSLEKMINNYSQFIAENGAKKDFLNSEFKTIDDFFNLNFEDRYPSNPTRFNYNNLCMIYLILRVNKKLDTQITIPRDAIYYDCKKKKLDPEGYLKRIIDIRNILIRKGVI